MLVVAGIAHVWPHVFYGRGNFTLSFIVEEPATPRVAAEGFVEAAPYVAGVVVEAHSHGIDGAALD